MFRSFFFFIFVFLPNVAFAEVKHLAVLEFQGIGVNDPAILLSLSDGVRSGLIKNINADQFLVMTRESILEILKDNGKDSSCMVGECEVEVGRNIGAHYIISGTVTKITETYLVTLKLHDTTSSALLASDQVKSTNALELIDKMASLGQLLMAEGNLLANTGGSQNTANVQEGFSGSQQKEWKAGKSGAMIAEIDTTPNGEDVVVLVDSKVFCKKTPCKETLMSGPHNVSIQKERYKEWRETVVFSPGKKLLVDLEPDFGYFSLKTVRKGVQFKLGKELLNSPVHDKILSKGTYKLEIVDPCFMGVEGQEYTFQITAGDKKSIDFQVRDRNAGIDVSVVDMAKTPVEASLSVDGKKIGKSPGTFTVNVCSKNLKAKNGDEEAFVKLKLKEEEVSKYKLQTKPIYKPLFVSWEPLNFNAYYSSSGPVLGYNMGIFGTLRVKGFSLSFMHFFKAPQYSWEIFRTGIGASLLSFGALQPLLLTDQIYEPGSDTAPISVFPIGYQAKFLANNIGYMSVEYRLHWLWAYAQRAILPDDAVVLHELSYNFHIPIPQKTNEVMVDFVLGPKIAMTPSGELLFGGHIDLAFTVDLNEK